MNPADLSASLNQAEEILSNANRLARRALYFSAGRLRSMAVDPGVLRQLKRELQKFDTRRGCWK